MLLRGEEEFHHVDRNLLHRVADPVPNPLHSGVPA
jgi:hypothetical protein